MSTDNAWVRVCQSDTCKAVLLPNERRCTSCGRYRARRCWSVEMLGAVDGERTQAEDALDRAFNTDYFVGSVRGQILQLEARTWRLTRAVMRIGRNRRVADGVRAIASALEAVGLRAIQVPQAPIPA